MLSSSAFATLLASLAAAGPGPAAQASDGLADDIATLSYEQALRSHARYRPAESAAQPLPQGRDAAQPLRRASSAPAPPQRRSNAPRERRKSASITIRLSEAESVQMRARAAEAGLTISAYLRSCAFEVESLRSQVKEALVEMRSAANPANGEQASPRQAFSPQPTWRARLLPRWAAGQRPAHA